MARVKHKWREWDRLGDGGCWRQMLQYQEKICYLGGAAGCSGTAQTCQQARLFGSLAWDKGIEGQAGWEQKRNKIPKSSSESTSLTLNSATAI